MAAKDVIGLLEQLAALGIELSEDQKKAAEDLKAEAFKSRAVEVFTRKVPQNENESKKNYETRIAAWQSSMFQMADKVSEDFASREANKGRGTVLTREFRIETPAGSLKVELTNPVEK